MKEAQALAQSGVREINLIAQDLTAYGRDRKDGTTLYALLRELDGVGDLAWIRLLYAYPNYLDDKLLEIIRDSEKICSYLDIPFQHVNRAILQRMRRGKMPNGWDAAVPSFDADAKGMASRGAGGKVLNAFAAKVPWLLGGAADLAPSTKTKHNFDGAGSFSACPGGTCACLRWPCVSCFFTCPGGSGRGPGWW